MQGAPIPIVPLHPFHPVVVLLLKYWTSHLTLFTKLGWAKALKAGVKSDAQELQCTLKIVSFDTIIEHKALIIVVKFLASLIL